MLNVICWQKDFFRTIEGMSNMSPPKGGGRSFPALQLHSSAKCFVDLINTDTTILVGADGIDLRDEYSIFSLKHCQSDIGRGAANVTGYYPCSIRGFEGMRQILATGLCLRQIDNDLGVWTESR